MNSEIDDCFEPEEISEEVTQSYEVMMKAYNAFKKLIRSKDKHLFERWKAGGYIIDDDIISMYPNATEVYEQMT